ncbi:hypothetical protein AN169_02850 [Staphylococcus aureus]|nr:hypothetical protein AN169_02850 [Staphylococcus aureus]
MLLLIRLSSCHIHLLMIYTILLLIRLMNQYATNIQFMKPIATYVTFFILVMHLTNHIIQ